MVHRAYLALDLDEIKDVEDHMEEHCLNMALIEKIRLAREKLEREVAASKRPPPMWSSSSRDGKKEFEN